MPPTAPKPTLSIPRISITEPAPWGSRVGGHVTQVRCAGTGATGTICACGTATSDGAQLTAVWGQVVIGAMSQLPGDPSGAKSGAVDGSGNWSFLGGAANEVPNAPCIDNPTADNAQFIVWCQFSTSGTGPLPSKATVFAAQRSNMTNCDGSGNPCGARLQSAQMAGATTATVATAPRQYQVKAQGARGPLASHVNTTWALALKTGGCGCTFAWDNDGDGLRVPRVVLRPDGVISTAWDLTLVWKGRRARYSCPAHQWSVLGVNRLRRASGDESLPKTLIVTPV